MWEPVLADLRVNTHGLLASQLSTPWRLTLALTVFRDGGDPAELLPGPMPTPPRPPADQYALRLDRLLLSRYVSAKVRLHTPPGGYSPGASPEVADRLGGWAGLGRRATADRPATSSLINGGRPAGQLVTRLVHMTVVAVFSVPWFIIATLTVPSFSQPAAALIGASLLQFRCRCLGAVFAVPAESWPAGYTSCHHVVPALARGGLVLGLLTAIPWGRPVGLAGPLEVGVLFALVLGLLAGIGDTAPQALGLARCHPGRRVLRARVRARGRAHLRARRRAHAQWPRNRSHVRCHGHCRNCGHVWSERVGSLPHRCGDRCRLWIRTDALRRVLGLGSTGGASALVRDCLPVPTPSDRRLAHHVGGLTNCYAPSSS